MLPPFLKELKARVGPSLKKALKPLRKEPQTENRTKNLFKGRKADEKIQPKQLF